MSRIKFDKGVFTDAFAIGSQMSGKTKAFPILDMAKVTIKDDSAIISSYDMNVAITKRTSVLQSDEDIAFCVNGKDFLNILHSIKDKEIDIEVSNKIVTVLHSKGEMQLPIFDVKDFPKPIMDDNCKELVIDSQSLSPLLREAKCFCGNDPLRPIMSCVNVYVRDGVLGVFASDGTILYNDERGDNGCMDMDLSFNVPQRAIDAILNATNNDEMIKISVGKRNIQVRGGDAAVIATMIEGNYPNASAVIPKTHNTELSVNKSELLESIKRASLTCNQSMAIVEFQAFEDCLRISSQDIDFAKNSDEKIKCDLSGQSITIAMKYTLVMIALSVLGDNVLVLMTDNSKATIWKDTENNSKIVLIMPSLVG